MTEIIYKEENVEEFRNGNKKIWFTAFQ